VGKQQVAEAERNAWLRSPPSKEKSLRGKPQRVDGPKQRRKTKNPKSTDATIAVDGKEVCWLSFIVRRPDAADLAIKVKVTRPRTNAQGLHLPILGPGDRGSWVWIGKGAQQGMAVLFGLDAAESLTWIVLTQSLRGRSCDD
jgi:hypothetical protein